MEADRMTLFDVAVLKAKCDTVITGTVAIWIEDDMVRFRAFGVSWTITRTEGCALADDIRRELYEEGPFDPSCYKGPGLIVSTDHENTVSIGYAGENAKLVLDDMDAEALADWLKGETVCEFDDIPDYSEEGDIE